MHLFNLTECIVKGAAMNWMSLAQKSCQIVASIQKNFWFTFWFCFIFGIALIWISKAAQQSNVAPIVIIMVCSCTRRKKIYSKIITKFKSLNGSQSEPSCWCVDLFWYSHFYYFFFSIRRDVFIHNTQNISLWKLCQCRIPNDFKQKVMGRNCKYHEEKSTSRHILYGS